MTRLIRRIASFAALATLAFGQIVMTAHACDHLMVPVEAPIAAEHDCCDKTPPPATICEHQCEYAATTADTQVAPSAIAPAAPLAVRVETVTFRNIPARPLERPLERRGEPPPLALFGNLRI